MGMTAVGAGRVEGAGEADGSGAGGAIATPGRTDESGPVGPVWSSRTLLVSMAALLAEAVITTVGLTLYSFIQEGPSGNGFMAAFVLPFALVLGALPGFVLTVTLVLPTLSLARRAARWGGWQGPPKWWWTAAAAPFTAAGATLAYGTVLALLTRSVGPPRAYLVCWLVLAAAAVPAALLAAVAGRGTGARRTAGLVLTVVGAGFLAAFVLGVGILATGL
ncbi:hypothetical protein ACFWJW_25520 [Streptomyces sp. NPDC127097]|uniref:hypothetical protein n=1 Tax=Streptomyces sp. NPDC127097 TaxID=3347136 RepID=UPI003666E546